MSTEEAAFLAAITAAPDDPHVRLVYADWLEDHGDPLAELIRAEVERSQLSPLDPKYWEARRRAQAIFVADDRSVALGYGDVYWPMFDTIPDDRTVRWRQLDRFVELWFGQQLSADSGESEADVRATELRLGIQFPAALREFYRLIGRMLNTLGRQDAWATLNQVDCLSGYVRIRWENQGCCWWGVRIADWETPDPPVWCHEDRTTQRDATRLSSFVLMALAQEAFFCAPWMSFDDSGRFNAELREKLQSTNLGDGYWVFRPYELREGQDLLCTMDRAGFSYVAARNVAALDVFSPSLRTELTSLRESLG